MRRLFLIAALAACDRWQEPVRPMWTLPFGGSGTFLRVAPDGSTIAVLVGGSTVGAQVVPGPTLVRISPDGDLVLVMPALADTPTAIAIDDVGAPVVAYEQQLVAYDAELNPRWTQAVIATSVDVDPRDGSVAYTDAGGLVDVGADGRTRWNVRIDGGTPSCSLRVLDDGSVALLQPQGGGLTRFTSGVAGAVSPAPFETVGLVARDGSFIQLSPDGATLVHAGGTHWSLDVTGTLGLDGVVLASDDMPWLVALSIDATGVRNSHVLQLDLGSGTVVTAAVPDPTHNLVGADPSGFLLAQFEGSAPTLARYPVR